MAAERQGVYIDTDESRWWLAVDSVRRFIEPPERVSRIPGLPRGFIGVAWLDGEAWPVVSLAEFGAARAILADDGEVRAVLLVERARLGPYDADRDARIGSLPQVLEKYVG